MRALALLALCGLALLAGACSSDGGGDNSSDNTIVSVFSDPAFADRALSETQGLFAASGTTAQAALDPASADLVVAATAPNDKSASFITRYWAVAVALPYQGRELTSGDLEQALAGGRRVLVPSDPPPPVQAWFPQLQVVVGEPVALADIPAALASDTSALALLPLDAVDVRVRTLAVDGVSLVFGVGDPVAYPLVERAYVSRNDGARGSFADQLDVVVPQLAARLGVTAPAPIVLRATGDILPVRCALARMQALGDLTHAFLPLAPWLADADITAGSLDASLSDANEPFGCTETFSLMAPSAAADGLSLSGFDVITVATNHVKDCGVSPCGDQAFFDTLENLRSRGIEPVGGGATLAEARTPAILTVKGVRFAFLGYDEIASYYHAEPGVPGTAPLDEGYLREDIAAAAAQADVVIVMPQWGIEYQAEPTDGQRQLAAVAAEAGADLVIGNHPHWVEAAEVIDGVFVAYALGNFVFDQDWSLETQQGAVLQAAFFGAQLKGIEYYPVHIYDEHQPRFADPEEAQQILDRIWNASATLD